MSHGLLLPFIFNFKDSNNAPHCLERYCAPKVLKILVVACAYCKKKIKQQHFSFKPGMLS